ncbi:MAG: outer membrane beta-barrel protein [Alphaproteobacteria bacterium]|nr:outer membrane beta-barrel protein [Alphaproteobacteria bacterium]
MKNALLASAALLVVASLPAQADGVRNGWYVGGSIGANWLQDVSPLTFSSDHLNTDFDTGWAMTAAVGYRCLGGFRGELELAYRKNDVNSIYEAPNSSSPIHHTHVGGDATQFSVMANAAYDWQVAPRWAVSVGGGLGIVQADFDSSGSGIRLVRDAEDDWTFAWQLIGGLAYSVTDNTDAFVEYRYFANDTHDVVTYPNGIPLRSSVDLNSNTVSVGFRYALAQ